MRLWDASLVLQYIVKRILIDMPDNRLSTPAGE